MPFLLGNKGNQGNHGSLWNLRNQGNQGDLANAMVFVLEVMLEESWVEGGEGVVLLRLQLDNKLCFWVVEL